MNLVERARNILLTPQTEWVAIEAEPTDPKTLYTSYIAILALIPAVAGLIVTVFLASLFGSRIGGRHGGRHALIGAMPLAAGGTVYLRPGKRAAGAPAAPREDQ